jgi:hypothetical protein
MVKIERPKLGTKSVPPSLILDGFSSSILRSLCTPIFWHTLDPMHLGKRYNKSKYDFFQGMLGLKVICEKLQSDSPKLGTVTVFSYSSE